MPLGRAGTDLGTPNLPLCATLSWILLPTEPRAHNGFLNASARHFRRAPELTVWGGNGAIEGRWQKGGGMGHNCYGFVSWTASESERQPASSWLEPGAAYGGGVFWEGACPVPRFWLVNRPGDNHLWFCLLSQKEGQTIRPQCEAGWLLSWELGSVPPSPTD